VRLAKSHTVGRRSIISKILDTAIVGAGPYGLSIAAHLGGVERDFRVYGKPMETWQRRMPKGMLLKSDGFASSLSALTSDGSLGAYCARNGIPYDDLAIPVSLATFVDYSLDFQRRFVPTPDERLVIGLHARDGGFELRLDDGKAIGARRVVLAVGITHFDYIPPVLQTLPPELASHSSAHHNLDHFTGRDVTVIGAGASAVDLAVLLDEIGAKVRIVARRPEIRFGSAPNRGGRSRWESIRHPQSGLGPGLRSRIFSDLPDLFRYLPSRVRLEIVRRHLGPASAWHLRPRVIGRISTILGHSVSGAEINGDSVQLTLRSAEGGPITIRTEHVIAATGYSADVDRLRFIDTKLRSRIRRVGKMPILSSNFESSVTGLYFVGLAAAGTFGPMLRFMYGCNFTARRVTKDILRR
jgi:ribulose 1,5-bisphosphate synthetase/thiazole synthase